MTSAFTVRLDDDLVRRLDELAKQTDRSRNWLATKAIEEYVALHDWQVAQVMKGIADADAGRFATEAEVEAVFARYRAAE